MGLEVWFNCDTDDVELSTSGVNWIEYQEGQDTLIFSNGSADVDDGEPLPSQQELISAGVVLTGVQVVIDRYFLADQSANLLREIFNMGNENKRYVVAFDFDGDTASEPTLEAYDDGDLDTSEGEFLGGGTPSNSFIRGITTTYNAPGANWALGVNAVKLAGSANGNFLYLNDQNGPLSGADTLYCNLCVVIPASQTTGFSSNVALVVKWLDN